MDNKKLSEIFSIAAISAGILAVVLGGVSPALLIGLVIPPLMANAEKSKTTKTRVNKRKDLF